MIIGSIRSGLVEAVHPVAVAAVDANGTVVASSGDVEGREFYLRSSLKPIQALISEQHGANLGMEQLAIAGASHRGQPVHIAYVEQMLFDVGLGAGHLRCPPDRPGSAAADRLWASQGRSEPEVVFHNCSGKHAAMLRSCLARNWSLEYTAPNHPLHGLVAGYAAEVIGHKVTPVGIDGCGVPTVRSDVVGLARMFAHIAIDPDFARVRNAAMRYASLTRDGDRPETAIARWFPAVVKGGAMGCIGIGWSEGGIGFAAKCWTGEGEAADVAILSLMSEMGVVTGYPRDQLRSVMAPDVLGGGEPVGHLEVTER